MKLVIGGILALVAMIMAFPQLNLQWNIIGAILIVAFGFLFVTVSSRLTGEIGRLESEEVRLAAELSQIEVELKGEVTIEAEVLAKYVERDDRVRLKADAVAKLQAAHDKRSRPGRACWTGVPSATEAARTLRLAKVLG